MGEFEFLKKYFELLKSRNNDKIGDRFESHLRQLYKDGEISSSTYNIIQACISIGQNIEDLNNENLQNIKDLIIVGTEIKQEKDARMVLDKLSEDINKSKNSVKNPFSGYSGSSRGGC